MFRRNESILTKTIPYLILIFTFLVKKLFCIIWFIARFGEIVFKGELPVWLQTKIPKQKKTWGTHMRVSKDMIPPHVL